MAAVFTGRLGRIIKSSGSSFLLKGITFLCSFILTKLIISSYGSEVNGMINSITQFLGIIVLLEGGIGGIARAALYKPLAKKNEEEINKIIAYIQRFFRFLALIFAVYALCVSLFFPFFATGFDFWFSFSLVLIISLSYLFEYCFGISYTILINSDQKAYVGNIFSFIYTISTFIASIILIPLNVPIHIVKLVCAGLLVSKPLVLSIYVRKKYHIVKTKVEKGANVLPQKWDGLSVHIAYYLHRNTDVVLITLFLSLADVSVYSVYNMVISGLLTVMGSFSLGFEAALGDIHASGDVEKLKRSFNLYSYWFGLVSTFVFICAMSLILPFVSVYTSDVMDANYYQPVLAFILVIAEYVYCLRVPYNDLMVATNSFKKIRFGAIMETVLNIVVSIVFAFILGLPGVAIGTLTAMLFRLTHFMYFFKKSHIDLPIWPFLKRYIVNIFCFVACLIYLPFLNTPVIDSYFTWIIVAIEYAIFVISFILIFNVLFMVKDVKMIYRFLKKK